MGPRVSANDVPSMWASLIWGRERGCGCGKQWPQAERQAFFCHLVCQLEILTAPTSLSNLGSISKPVP